MLMCQCSPHTAFSFWASSFGSQAPRVQGYKGLESGEPCTSVWWASVEPVMYMFKPLLCPVGLQLAPPSRRPHHTTHAPVRVHPALQLWAVLRRRVVSSARSALGMLTTTMTPACAPLPLRDTVGTFVQPSAPAPVPSSVVHLEPSSAPSSVPSSTLSSGQSPAPFPRPSPAP